MWTCQNSQLKAICSIVLEISINPHPLSCNMSQTEPVLHLSFLIQMKMCNVQHQCGMTREPAVPSWATASQCDVKCVLHFGACGFDSRMFYCWTMFLPWSAEACIKSILSLGAHPQHIYTAKAVRYDISAALAGIFSFNSKFCHWPITDYSCFYLPAHFNYCLSVHMLIFSGTILIDISLSAPGCGCKIKPQWPGWA